MSAPETASRPPVDEDEEALFGNAIDDTDDTSEDERKQPTTEEIDHSLFDDVNDDADGSTANTNDDNDTSTITGMLAQRPPPQPLPAGWFLKQSHSQPGCFYYFNQDSGECCWELNLEAQSADVAAPTGATVGFAMDGVDSGDANANISQESLNATAAAAAAAVKSILKRSSVPAPANNNTPTFDIDDNTADASPTSRKKAKISSGKDKKHKSSSSSSTAAASDNPKEVRVLHILKKHSSSRRPSSWRQSKITITKPQAIAELHELLSILQEVKSNPKELRATFEELAKTESDCSSAKRGGDLGFFGRKKMQPAFEKASFDLGVGELTEEVVDTSSGVHIILRLA
jgi:NIMA-interacting peptidyl-prolyl cis-trans isomerase 1